MRIQVRIAEIEGSTSDIEASGEIRGDYRLGGDIDLYSSFNFLRLSVHFLKAE